jgi:hypothetical protein
MKRAAYIVTGALFLTVAAAGFVTFLSTDMSHGGVFAQFQPLGGMGPGGAVADTELVSIALGGLNAIFAGVGAFFTYKGVWASRSGGGHLASKPTATTNTKSEFRRSGFAFSELLLPLVAVSACLVTVWVATTPSSRGAFKSLFRQIELRGIDLRGLEDQVAHVITFLRGHPRAVAEAGFQDVLVASIDLRPGQALTNEHMRWQPWPQNALNSVYITRSGRPDALETLVGSMVCYRISFSEPIREANLESSHLGSRAANCVAARDMGGADPAKPPIVIRGGKQSAPIR